MSANKENNLVQAYLELNKFCQSSDYERALKAAGKILQIAPNEQKAFHCKVVCFLQLHNFKEALATLTNAKNSALAADLLFEKAYAQYRLNSPKEALQTVDSAPELTPALKELRAQILYRLEQYQDCYNLYRDLLKNTTDEYEDERKANMAAVVANLAALNPTSELPQFDENTYELAYNSGSTLAMRGKYNEALSVLKRAEQACSESVIDDGGTEEEAKEEAAIIRVQQAYCLQQINREKEAATIYQNILKDKPSDQALVAIASNNIIVINRDTNVFDSRKRMKAATAEGLEHKLNSRQRAVITYNQAILSIYSNQPDFCKQCCVKLVRDFGEDRRAAIVEASSLVKEGKAPQAVSLLLKHGGTLTLAAVQILLVNGDRKAAIKLLQESEYKHRPGVVGVLCTLLCADNELEKASLMFDELYEHVKNDAERMKLYRGAWRGAARCHGRAGRAGAAARAHEALAAVEPRDARSLARLVKALAAADPPRARSLAEQLPPLDQLETKIDIDALESSKWMMGAKVVKKTVQSKQEQSPGTPGSELGQKKKTKRKRNSKLPPNADLSKPPDPERWLPKYERTAYRKRRGIRRDVIKGSQGMSTTATDQYDMSKQQTTPTPATSAKSPRVEVKQTESAWQRKQQQKKKGKGRKW
ncbi:signal recognition particle subunit SRP72 isoform X2 [Bombyx mandarina]|uniref:Signal recognition particle subunit SRP72 n=1 Tax=Bombyx mandarina TaxID=7092 RepID=A0A6J2JBA7_BOMMA|nr:signal recognition particle subunit SRP72 isoform X1 [Bombyx mandarina]XP_028026412.1 signal recognition particle subunit SRP72 isoform X2 [Bombyx mandarina]